jgi:hypothetical protein
VRYPLLGRERLENGKLPKLRKSPKKRAQFHQSGAPNQDRKTAIIFPERIWIMY